MTRRMGVVGIAALAAVACGSASTTGSPSASTQGSVDLFNPTNFNTSNVPWLAKNVNGGTPQMGGTLSIEGSIDFSAALDPQGEYETQGYTIERAFTRQLVSYPPSSDFAKSVELVPDAASAMPTVSSDGLTYTFHLRSGLMWNTSPPRAVTSQDFARGILRNCDPTLYPNGNPGYYVSTIVGFGKFCTAFEAQSPTESAAARAATLNSASVSGIQTPDPQTIVFTLTEPASDFNNILSLPFASAAPVEDNSFVPLTPGNKLYSDGPYEITTYNVGHEVDLDRNPAWSQGTDPIRHAYVNAIHVKLDLAGSAASTLVQQDMEAGSADLPLNTVVPTEDINGFETPTWNPDFGTFPAPGGTNNYVVFNVQSPNAGGALGKVAVRRALEYAVNKIAADKIYGGAAINQPLDQVLGPGAEGYVKYNDYPANNDLGDPGKCKSLLATAGYPSGLTLKEYYRNNGNHPALYQELLSDFGKCGVTIVGTPIATGYYGSSGIGVTTPNDLKKGNWDIAEAGWGPDWFGPANARSILPAILSCATFPGSNWGGYCDPATDALIAKALAATTLAASAAFWHQADQQIMADAPFIPVHAQLLALFHSSRVHNALYFPFAEQYDVTQLWLSS